MSPRSLIPFAWTSSDCGRGDSRIVALGEHGVLAARVAPADVTARRVTASAAPTACARLPLICGRKPLSAISSSLPHLGEPVLENGRTCVAGGGFPLSDEGHRLPRALP